MRLIAIFLFCLTAFAANAQTDFKKETIDFQKELNEEYANAKTSPLDPDDLKNFKGHDFFPVDSIYSVTAKFVLLKHQKPFKMLTTKGTEKEYVKYAELLFVLNGKEYKLTAYQGIELRKQKEYADYLFVPFRDPSNGTTTYEGGRFMDLRIPKGNTLAINFNKAYNPYCAYSHNYACPITPAENSLDVEIPAGVRMEK